jgi:adenine-specific DNA-methyltransferase
MPGTCDYLIWYAKNIEKLKFRGLLIKRSLGEIGAEAYSMIELPDGSVRRLTREEMNDPESLQNDARVLRYQLLTSQREGRPSGPGSAMHFAVRFNGTDFYPEGTRGWTLRRMA